MDKERMLNDAERAVQLRAKGTLEEKVRQSLDVCSEWKKDENGEFGKECYRCVYLDKENDPLTLMCAERLMKDAGKIIDEKNGRARLLKLSEIPKQLGAVWIEWHGGDKFLEPALYRYEQIPFFRFSGKDHAFGMDMNMNEYGSSWRAWSWIPTDEQRKEAVWT